MARSSSAQKIARLAQKGKGKKVRFQGGSTFATVILAIILVGSILVAYARQSEPVVDASLTAEQQYALSFGVYVCDEFVQGIAAVPAADAIDPEASTTIVGEGLVLWKPQVLAGERKARLGTIFDLYGLEVTDSSITFPASVSVNGGQPVEEGTTECDGEPGSLVVVTWPDALDTATSERSIASFDGVRLTDDNMAIVLAFIKDGADVPQPDSAAEVSTVQRQG
ncbi:MAG: hypothetical protein ACKOFZ_01505 [Ilumatobacteraceae bacterium]